MKTKFKLLVVIVLLGVGLNAQTAEVLETKPKKLRYAVALNGSALGVGAELGIALNQRMAIRVRGNFLSLRDALSGDEQDIGGETFIVNAGPKSTEVDVCFEYLPFKNSSFKLVGGLGYFFEGDFTVHSVNRDGFSYGDMLIPGEDVGTLDFNVDYSGIAPYAGFGFGRAVPKKRIGIGFELGTFYLGEPNGTIATTELLTENLEAREETFQNDISDYRWYPFVNLRIAINLSK